MGWKIRPEMENLKRVLIISTSSNEQDMLEEVNNTQPTPWILETIGSFGQNAEWWSKNAPDALILKLPTDEFLQNFFFSKLRADVGKHIPLLFVCETISASLMQTTTEFAKVRILKMPVNAFELFRTTGELLASYEPGHQQASPRYMTNQKVTVTSDFRTGKLQGTMKNLSISGAFFEAEKNAMGIKNGDLVRIQILVPGVKEYVFDAKIVWVRETEGMPIGFGCTFVDKDEVYKNLLKGI
jgi:hypothetical protein